MPVWFAPWPSRSVARAGSPSEMLFLIVLTVRLFSLALFAAVIGACVRPPKPALEPVEIEPVTVSREMVYAHSAEAVTAAYRRAFAARLLTAEVDASGALTAVTPPLSAPGRVRVVIGPSDTLTTRVTLTYRYERAGETFFHYPYRLPLLASPHLDSTLASVSLHQGTYPQSLRSCPWPKVDTSSRIEDPRLAAGAPALASRVEYSEAARQREVEGIVYLAVLVNEEGRVTCVEVLSGLPHGLTESAVTAMMRAVFVPARQHGQPVAVRVVQPVWFKLLE